MADWYEERRGSTAGDRERRTLIPSDRVPPISVKFSIGEAKIKEVQLDQSSKLSE